MALLSALESLHLFQAFPFLGEVSERVIGQRHLGVRLGLLHTQLCHGRHFLASLDARKQVPVQSIVLSDVQIAGGIVGINGHRRPEVRNSLVQFAGALQSYPETILGDEIRPGHLQGVRPKSDIVAPVVELNTSHYRQRQ